MKPVSCRLLLIGLSLILVAASSLIGAAPAAKTANTANPVKAAIERGKAFLDKDDYPAAIRAFSDALRLDPKSVAALNGRGNAYRLADKCDSALSDFNEALRLEPKNSEAHRGRGGVYWAKKDLKKALAESNEAIRCDPKNAAAYRSRGAAHADRREFDEAMSDLTEAIRLNPKDADSYNGRGCLYAFYRHKGEYDRAFSDFAEAIRLNPECRSVYTNRGNCYLLKGEYDKAIVDYTETTRVDPNDFAVYYLRAGAFENKDEHDKAIADLTHLILKSKQAIAYFARGSIYEKKGDLQKAEDDFAQARQLRLKAVLEQRGLAKATSSKAAIESVNKSIHEEVKRLEYSDAVAQELVTLVGDWNLAAVKEKLAAAKDRQRHGTISKVRLAQTEGGTAESLCLEIAAVVRYNAEVRELDEVIRAKSACCVGYALMFDVLGRSIGLDVQGLEVPIMACGQTIDGQGHMACLMHFADGQVAIADVTRGLGDESMVSAPFRFAETYREQGTYSELREEHNPMGLHRLVLPLDNEGILGVVLLCRASKCVDKGDLQSARILVAEAMRRNPRCADAYSHQGRIDDYSGDKDRAIADYSAAIEHNPLYANAYMWRGQVYAGTDPDRSLADLEEAARLNPKLAEAYAARGLMRIYKAESDKAAAPSTEESKNRIRRQEEQGIADCAEAIRLDPKNASYYRLRSQAFTLSGQIDKALADLNEAIRLNSKDATALTTRSRIYENQGDLAKAITDLNDAIDNDPSSADAFFSRGRILLEQFQIDRSLADLNEAIRINPKMSLAFATRGSAHFCHAQIDKRDSALTNEGQNQIQREQEQALADYNEAIRLDPKVAWNYKTRGRIYAACGEHERALADLTEAIGLDPKDVDALTVRSQIYERKGDIDKEIADLDQAIHIDPKLAEAYAARGVARMRRAEKDAPAASADWNKLNRPRPVLMGYYPSSGTPVQATGTYPSPLTGMPIPVAKGYYPNSPNGGTPVQAAGTYPGDYLPAGSVSSSPLYNTPYQAPSANPTIDCAMPKIDASASSFGKAQARHDSSFPKLLPDATPLNPPNPEDVQARKVRAATCQGQIKRELEQALADLSDAIRLDPTVSSHFKVRASLYVTLNHLDKSLADLDEAIRLDPKDAEAFSTRSKIYEGRGDLDKAIADMGEVIRLNPKSSEAYGRRGDLHFKKHETDKAVADYVRAAKPYPEDNRYR